MSTPTLDRRAEVIFDALAMANGDGMLSGELLAALDAAGLIDGLTAVDQIVRVTVMHLRELLNPDGAMPGAEVIPCRKAGKDSRYFIAATPEQALFYRQRRLHEIAVNIATQVRQVQTEHARFGGQEVFTDAALDYLASAVRELDRAGALRIVP
jgi:hypothetical protein